MCSLLRRIKPKMIVDTVAGFGKLPMCAEFIKYGLVSESVIMLDHWYREGYQTFIQQYGRASKSLLFSMPSYHFLFSTAGTSQPLVGSVFPGQDLGGRPYPFVLGRLLQSELASEFKAAIPLLYADYFQATQQFFHHAKNMRDRKEVIDALQGLSCMQHAQEKLVALKKVLSQLRSHSFYSHQESAFFTWLIMCLKKILLSNKKNAIVRLPLPSKGIVSPYVVFYLQLFEALFPLARYRWQAYWQSQGCEYPANFLFCFNPLSPPEWHCLVKPCPDPNSPYDFFAQKEKTFPPADINMHLSLSDLIHVLVSSV